MFMPIFFGWLRLAVSSTFGVLFLVASDIFFIVALVLILTPLGGVRIGGRNDTGYSYSGCFAMLLPEWASA